MQHLAGAPRFHRLAQNDVWQLVAPQSPVLLRRQPQVDPTAAVLNRVVEHLSASESRHAPPLLANSRIFSGSEKVSFLGSGVYVRTCQTETMP
jgi:hypothetical protein